MGSEGEKSLFVGILIICVIAGAILIIMATGIFSSYPGERRVGRMMDSDRMFIEQMIPHHQDAIDMANLALERAEHPEIRQLAENIINDQSTEISWIRDWYKEWYVGPNTGGMGTFSDTNHSLPFLTEQDLIDAEKITKLTHEALLKETGVAFRGVMYGGFMKTRSGVKLIEYNARFGDPEVMNALTLLESDFVDLILPSFR